MQMYVKMILRLLVIVIQFLKQVTVIASKLKVIM
jgi:hypothetical protein